MTSDQAGSEYGLGAEVAWIGPDDLRAFVRGLERRLGGRAPTRAEWDAVYKLIDCALTADIHEQDAADRAGVCECPECLAAAADADASEEF